MIIVGVNEGRTKLDKSLADGGVAIIRDDQLVYVSAEERHTRIKADGGYIHALNAGFGFLHLNTDEVKHYYSSSCCEPRQKNINNNGKTIKYEDHHLSHAALSFFTSEFSEAVIIVADAGGNTLSEEMSGTEWADEPRQQLSIYHAKGLDICKVGTEFAEPRECGLGEMYRAFTHYLGWPLTRHAGKVMALAATGDTSLDKPHIFFEVNSSKIFPMIESFNPHEPKETARDLLLAIGRSDLIKEYEVNASDTAKAEIAKIAQLNLEFVLEYLVEKWTKELDCRNVCLGGGVALNCTAARRVREKTNCSLYIPPGAGDNGQCVGNALLGYVEHYGKLPIIENLAFLGGGYSSSKGMVKDLLVPMGCEVEVYENLEENEFYNRVTDKMCAGEIVLWYQGRSEFGARALGNRSVIVDPRQKDIVNKLNTFKHREWFNPFAASCLESSATKYFKDAYHSPYMTDSFEVLNNAVASKIPAVIHTDNSCRAQIFAREFNQRYYDLIRTFEEKTGVGLILNTSLNGAGEPIVETIEDCLSLFVRCSEVKILALNNLLIEKI